MLGIARKRVRFSEVINWTEQREESLPDWKVSSGYPSVQRWRTGHNWHEALSFRGVELDITTKKCEIEYSSVQRWWAGLNRLEIIKLRVFTVQRWLTGHNNKRKGEIWLSVGSEVMNWTSPIEKPPSSGFCHSEVMNWTWWQNEGEPDFRDSSIQRWLTGHDRLKH